MRARGLFQRFELDQGQVRGHFAPRRGRASTRKSASLTCGVDSSKLPTPPGSSRRALTRRLRSALLTAEEAADPLLATLAAPLMRWGKVIAGHIHDIVTAIVRHQRLPLSLIGLIREQVRDPNRGRVPLAGRTHACLLSERLAG